MRRIVKFVVVLVVVATMHANVLGAGFVESRPWLAERSAWSESTDGGGTRGWWAVGNGNVFGIVGPGLGAAQISQITGPHIMLAGVMNNGSAFGPAALRLTIDGRGVPFKKQTLSKVRGTDVVVMEFVSPDVVMTVFNYAPFGLNAILRTVVVENRTGADFANVVLTASVNRTRVVGGRLYDSFKGGTGGSAMGQTRQLFSSFIEPCEVSGPAEADKPGQGSLTLKIDKIAAGGEAVRTHYLMFSMEEIGDEADTLAKITEQNVNLLQKTYDDWRTWLATTTRLECPDARVTDLLDDTKIIVDIQTAKPQCAAGPMEFFAGVWVRDSNGPLLYHLRMGQLEVARNMLDFYYNASAQNKRIANWIPMDIDTSLPVPEDIDWSTVPNDPVEIPAWIILQHRWYYEYTGDLEPIKEHWGYLKRCLMGQIVDEEGTPFRTANFGSRVNEPNTMYRFPPHGDETWIYPGFEVLNSDVFPEPNDHPRWDAYCADSTWEFVAAADAITQFARLLDDDQAVEFAKIAADSRAACERDYWIPEKGLYGVAMDMRSLDVHQPPFPMINFNPLWIGYLQPDDPKAVANVLETMKYTMNPNFVTDASETLKVYVGMQPGMFLYNLAAIDHPYAEPALKAMIGVAAPSGEYTEKHVTAPDSYRSQFRGHRIRPWEGGINADAAYYYLTGLKPNMGQGRVALCPRLPSEWKQMAVRGQRLGDGALDVSVVDDGAKRSYELKWTGSKPMAVDFTISLTGAKIKSVQLDGEKVRVRQKSKWGVTTGALEVPLAAGATVAITVDYTKKDAPLPPFKRERYQYVVPENVPSHDMVLWENEPRKGNADKRTFDYLDGKVNYRLINATNPSDPHWLRPFLLKKKAKINTPLFVMGPNSVGNSLKWSKWWGNPELAALFTEYMEAGGVILAISTGESSSDYFGPLFKDAAYAVAPMELAPMVPAGDAGTTVCKTLKAFSGEAPPKSNRMFMYKNMVVLARPETDSASAVALAKRFGKGLFVGMLTDPANYELTASLALSFADAATLKAIKKTVARAGVESMPGAFEDQGKDGAFEDDFSSYKDGNTGLPVWQPIAGTWVMRDGEYHQTTPQGYDFCATVNVRVSGDYRIETSTRLVQGIQEGGFLFNIPSRFSKNGSQMVRFCGQPQLWCGPFSGGGGFSLANTIGTGKARDDEKWMTLTVTVRNSKGVYDIAVDGKEVAKDLRLSNVLEPGKSGYVGLVACRGHIAYDWVKVTAVKED